MKNVIFKKKVMVWLIIYKNRYEKKINEYLMVLELSELLKLWGICELRVYQSHPDHLKSNIELCTLPSTKKIKYILDNTLCNTFNRLKELRKQQTQKVWNRVNKKSWGLNNDVWDIILSYSEEFHIDLIIQFIFR